MVFEFVANFLPFYYLRILPNSFFYRSYCPTDVGAYISLRSDFSFGDGMKMMPALFC